MRKDPARDVIADVRAQVGAFVDETRTFAVDEDPVIPWLDRLVVPRPGVEDHRVEPVVLAGRSRAHSERHLDALSFVVHAATAHGAHPVGVRTQVPRGHLGVPLEPAGGKDHGACGVVHQRVRLL